MFAGYVNCSFHYFKIYGPFFLFCLMIYYTLCCMLLFFFVAVKQHHCVQAMKIPFYPPSFSPIFP